MSTDTPQDDAFDVSWSKPASGQEQPVTAPRITGYRIESPLGEGGMGTVWKAVQLDTGRHVALKMLKSGTLASSRAQQLFEEEIRNAAKLTHESIARIYHSGLLEGKYWYAMELVEGDHLDQYVAKQQLGERQILTLLCAVADAVEYAHLKGMIHRDLKPSNILIDQQGKPRVVDFGLAKMLSSQGEPSLSVVAELAGTPAYMSPEQASGDVGQLDTRSDVYSLGVILFRLLTSQHPHNLAGPRDEVLHRIAAEEVRRPRDINPHISVDLERLLLKTLQHDPDDRYVTAGELAKDVRNYLAGEPLIAGPNTRAYVLKKRLWKHKLLVAITTVVLGAFAGMALTSYLRVRHERDRALVAEGIASGQRVIAEQARQQADTRAEQLERALYFSRITLSRDAYSKNDLGHMRELLPLCPTELRSWEWRYLDFLANRTEREIATAQEGVSSVAFSPSGELIATAAWDGTIKLWNAATGTFVAQLPTDEQSLTYSVAFSPDGKCLVSAHFNDVVLWDISSRARIRTFDGHNSIVHRVRFSADGKSIASVAGVGMKGMVDNTLRLWDVATGKQRLVLNPDDSEALDCACSPDNARIVSAGREGIAIWNTATGKRVRILDKTNARAAHVEYSPDGKRIASSSGKAITVWDATTGKSVANLSGHDSDVTTLAFSPDGQRLASASDDRTLCIWEVTTGSRTARVPAHAGSVQGVAFDPRGKAIASVGGDNLLMLWRTDIADDRLELMAFPPGGAVASVAFSPDGDSLACAGSSTSISLWRLPSGKPTESLHGQQGGETGAVTWSNDGTRVAHGSGTEIVIADDTLNHRVFGLEAAYPANVPQTMKTLSLRADGRLLLSLDVSHALRLWDLVARKEVKTLEVLDTQFTSAAYAPRSNLIATGTRSWISIWEDTKAQPIVDIEDTATQEDVEFVAFSPDENLVAAASGKTIALWAWRTKQKLRSFSGHADRINAVAFSPDGTRLVSASDDHTVRLWDTETGAEALVLGGRDSEVLTVTFSRDGQKIASGDASGKVIVWQIAQHGGTRQAP